MLQSVLESLNIATCDSDLILLLGDRPIALVRLLEAESCLILLSSLDMIRPLHLVSFAIPGKFANCTKLALVPSRNSVRMLDFSIEAFPQPYSASGTEHRRISTQ